MKTRLRFALPSITAVFTELTVKLNDRDETSLLRLEDSYLVCERDVESGETISYEIAFRSRGLDYWYFQIPQRHQIPDFERMLTLADIPTAEGNYPEVCMTPTTLAPTSDDRGSLLTYRLDRAISTNGMGVALPKLEQSGRVAASILGEVEKGWVLMFSVILLELALTGNRCASLLTILFTAAVACRYGLLADLNDTFLGFWGGTIVVPAADFRPNRRRRAGQVSVRRPSPLWPAASVSCGRGPGPEDAVSDTCLCSCSCCWPRGCCKGASCNPTLEPLRNSPTRRIACHQARRE